MKSITSIEDALSLVEQELGTSDWLTVDQNRIDIFAEATGDKQWIHIDQERAQRESPYGATVAHGFLTLSLIPALSKQCYRVENATMAVNYGMNKVRFISAVPAGSRIRLRSKLAGAERVGESHMQLTMQHSVELEGAEKPAAIAETIVRIAF